ncbi:MAG: hypothetical protein Q7T55_07005 [Solirubrobacteraceae bacterium]|nr:hypothetical protein [Solirubrobacteraceae bacterium]
MQARLRPLLLLGALVASLAMSGSVSAAPATPASLEVEATGNATARTVSFKFGVVGDLGSVERFEVIRNGQPIGTTVNPAYPCSSTLDHPELTRWCVRDDNPPGGSTSYQISAVGTAASGGGTALSESLVLDTIAPPVVPQKCTYGIKFGQREGVELVRRAMRKGTISAWYSTHDCAGKQITVTASYKRNGVETPLGTASASAEAEPPRVKFTVPASLRKKLTKRGRIGGKLIVFATIDDQTVRTILNV